VQDRLAAFLGEPVAGWKIGCTSREAQTLMGIDAPFAGRVFASGLRTGSATLSAGDYIWCGLEGEFAFRLAADLPARAAPYDRAEVADAVDLMYPAIEIITSAFAADRWFGVGAPSVVADNGAHGALLLGPAASDWRDRDIAGHGVAMCVNGEVHKTGRGADALGHPLAALAWLATERSRRGRGLEAGQVVTTGTCTGLVTLSPGDVAVAEFGELGRVEVRFIA
jgi:2-keto-4-pentenoate hydratase